MISDELYDRTPLTRHDNNSLSKILEFLPEEGDVLDVGCATGKLGEYLSQNTRLKVDGIEFNAASAKLAEAHYRSVFSFDIEEMSSWQQVRSQYDVIIFADILEHLKSPEVVLDQVMRHHLKADGKILISVPNVGHVSVIHQLLSNRFHYQPSGLLDKTHLRFFSHHNLPEFFASLGQVSWRLLDRVVIGMQGTEFQPNLEKGISPQWLDILSHIPEGNTYQFILEVKPSETDVYAAERANAQPDFSGLYITPTVFYQPDEAADFGGGKMLCQTVKITDQIPEMTFTLPQGTRKIRFDPADIPGLVHLYKLVLLDASQTEIWSLTPDHRIREKSDALQTVWDESTQRMILKMDDFDPWLQLPVDADILSLAQTLLVKMDWPRTHDYFLLRQVLDQKLMDMKQQLTHLYEAQAHYLSQIDDLRNQLSEAQHRLVEADNTQAKLNHWLREQDKDLQQVVSCSKLARFYQKVKRVFGKPFRRNRKNDT